MASADEIESMLTSFFAGGSSDGIGDGGGELSYSELGLLGALGQTVAGSLDMTGDLDIAAPVTCVTPLDPLVTDEPAAFVHHINAEALSKASTAPCLSPTLITDKLMSPLSKRTKPTAHRGKPRTRDPEEEAASSKSSETEDTEAPPKEEQTSMDEQPQAATVEAIGVEHEQKQSVSVADAAETARLERMMRNRASAAQSRKRKRQQVEDLEADVASLRETVRKLTEQNATLRRECKQMADSPLEPASRPPPLAPCA